MTPQELLTHLRAIGVEVKTSGGDRLVVDAPRGTITEELRTALSANKAALLKILQDEDVTATHARAVAQAPPEPRLPESRDVPSAPQAQAPAPVPDEFATSTAEEIAQLRVELRRLRREEEARRAEAEAGRVAAETALRMEQE